MSYSGRYNNNNSSYSQSYDRNFNSPFQSQSRFYNQSDSNMAFQKPNNFSSQRSVWNTGITNSIPSLLSQPTFNPNAWQGNQNPISGNNPAWLSNRNNDNSQYWLSNNQNSWNARSNYQSNSRNNYQDKARSDWRRQRKPASTANRNKKVATKPSEKASQSNKVAGNQANKVTGNQTSKVAAGSQANKVSGNEQSPTAWRRKRRRTRHPKPTHPTAKRIKADFDSATKNKRDGTLVTITKKVFPMQRFTNEESDKLFEVFNAEAVKLDPKATLIKNVQKKKGSVYVVCKDEDSVKHVRTITKALTPWEGVNLRVTLPVARGMKQWIAIVSSKFPTEWFTTEQREALETALESTMNNIPEGEFYPEFLDYYKRRGTMLMACNNDETVKWLIETVPKLKAYEGDQPKTVDANELPCYFKIEFLVPPSPDSLDVTLERINRQNQGVNTKGWYIIRQTETEKGIEVIASIDADAYNHLKKLKFKLFLNFGTLEVKYLGLLKGPTNFKPAHAAEKEGDNDDEKKVKVEST